MTRTAQNLSTSIDC